MAARQSRLVRNKSPTFRLLLFAVATSLKISEKEDWIDHLQFNIYHIVQRLCQIGPADPEILWLRANKFGTKQNWLPWQRRLRNWKNWT